MSATVRKIRPSPRELQVLLLICQGHRNKQIATMLGVATKTVDVHRYNAMVKIGAHSVVDVLNYMIDRRHFTPPSLAQTNTDVYS